MIGTSKGGLKRRPVTKLSRKRTTNFVINIFVYVLLLEFVFVFLYPFLYLIINSLKFDVDLRDINRNWVLTGFNFQNYATALEVLDYGKTLLNTLIVVLLSTLGHALSCSLAGYGLARFKFVGSGVIFAMVILSIIIPNVLLSMPLYIQFTKWKWMGTMLPIIVPGFFGFGLRGGLFIFIFRQFFKGLPRSYEESAKLEGCSHLKIFFQIMLPVGKTSVLVCATLSTIWHWNDFIEPQAFLSSANYVLSQKLGSMADYLYWSVSATGESMSPVQLAACVLVILPLLVIFFLLQKKFIEGMEFSGLAN